MELNGCCKMRSGASGAWEGSSAVPCAERGVMDGRRQNTGKRKKGKWFWICQ